MDEDLALTLKDFVDRVASYPDLGVEEAARLSGISVYLDELTALRAENAWIPVTERLPKDRGYYLAVVRSYLGDAEWVQGLYYDGSQDWYSSQNLRRSPTHWRPLPAPPAHE